MNQWKGFIDMRFSGLDSDEVQFLLSALWDKIKISREIMPLSAISMGLQGLTLLNDPIASNIKQYLYLQLLQLPANIQLTNSTSKLCPLQP